MDMSLIQGTVAGLKLASDIAKGFLELKSLSDVQGKVIELQRAILSAQDSALAAHANQATMIETIRNMKEEIARLETWSTERQRFKLTELWDSGVVAYALKESMNESEPPHYICPNCYEEGRKSILNPQKHRNGRLMLVCQKCKNELHSLYSRDLPIIYAK